MKPWTIKRILEWTAKDLESRHISSPKLDAEVLLAHSLGIDRLRVICDFDRPLNDEELGNFRKIVSRRRQREPVAYITGTKEFWSLPLELDSPVLIPRPDTEVLVEQALDLLPKGEKLRAIDVGTGSGCIALALAQERPGLKVLGIDIEKSAAALAMRNARLLGLEDQVRTVVGDLLEPVIGMVDLIISNPPYIPSKEIDGLEPEISRWEPRLALDGGEDGLDIYKRLLHSGRDVLTPEGHLVMEVGHDQQAAQVLSLMDDAWELVKVQRDYGNTQRVVIARARG